MLSFFIDLLNPKTSSGTPRIGVGGGGGVHTAVRRLLSQSYIQER